MYVSENVMEDAFSKVRYETGNDLAVAVSDGERLDGRGLWIVK